MSKTLRIPAPGFIKGRNGAFDIVGIELWVPEQDDFDVWVDGVGKRGKVINGGLRIAPTGFDEVCRQYLETRGWQVSPPNGAHDGGGSCHS